VYVGIGPGYNEDQEGDSFVGPSGEKLLDFYTYGANLDAVADIYATNVVRCLPPANKPSAQPMKACSRYLYEDIGRVVRRYPRVLIVPVGAIATKFLTGRTLDAQLKHPFQKMKDIGRNVWLHATYHPSRILHDPRESRVVMQHMLMINEWLVVGRIEYEDMPIPEYCPEVSKELFRQGDPFCFDLETYGCLKRGWTQTQFDPIKMHKIDKVPIDKIIVSIHTAWRDPTGKLRLGWYQDRMQAHRERFWEWLDRAGILVGQNFPFDVKLIRYCHGRDKIPYWRPLQDSMVETFVLDDLNPRSLKAIAPLYRITDYGDDPPPVKVYEGVNDPKLIVYGCKDSWTTLRLCEISWALMQRKFHSHRHARLKTTKRRVMWFSNSMWSKILMEESGIPFDTDKLVAAFEAQSKILDSCVAELWKDYGYVAIGKGSQGSVRGLFKNAVNRIGRRLETDLSLNPEQVDVDLSALNGIGTTDTGLVKTDADTRNLLQGLAPANMKIARALSVYAEVKGAQKILGYIGPRLYGKEKTAKRYKREVQVNATPEGEIKSCKTRKILLGPKRDFSERLIRVYSRRRYTGIAMAHPSWFILPKSDDKGKKGGVRQYRWSAKGPPVQTDPPIVKYCMTSRYRKGLLGNGDYSRMEWGMAAFIANDVVMLREIALGLDPHIKTASYLLNVDLENQQELRRWLKTYALSILCRCPKHIMRTAARKFTPCKSSDYPVEFLDMVVKFCRQEGGKSENFAYLFGAMAKTVLATMRTKAGFEIPLTRCDGMIRRNDKKYKQLAAMRKRDIEEAIQYGAIHLPILGLSRTFGDSPDDIRGKSRGQVYDLAIQALSGLVLQSAIVETQKFQVSSALPFHVIINNHDAMVIDSRWDVAQEVFAYARDRLLSNWFLRKLERHFGRKFPVKVDMEVLATRGIDESEAKDMMEKVAT
jgi:uracil-DNA glycosylase family 4